jgi:hypothetical protein
LAAAPTHQRLPSLGRGCAFVCTRVPDLETSPNDAAAARRGGERRGHPASPTRHVHAQPPPTCPSIYLCTGHLCARSTGASALPAPDGGALLYTHAGAGSSNSPLRFAGPALSQIVANRVGSAARRWHLLRPSSLSGLMRFGREMDLCVNGCACGR